MSLTKVLFGILLVFAFNYAVKPDLETAFKLGDICVEYVKHVFLPKQAPLLTNWQKFCVKFGFMDEPQPEGGEWLRWIAIGLVIYFVLTFMAFLYHCYESRKLAKQHWRDEIEDKPRWVKPITDQKSETDKTKTTNSRTCTCQKKKSVQFHLPNQNPVHIPAFVDRSTQTTDDRHANAIINFQSAELITLDKRFLMSKQAGDRMSKRIMSQEYLLIQQEDNAEELQNKSFYLLVVAVVGVLHMLYDFCLFMYPLLIGYIY